ncbi:flavin reductase family protein [Streptomyces cyaneus]|uniref:flavin reductase family protein n=1 Tax=Streptomyces cyaneus TaxID=1904 RepID=UPI000FF8804F|nr:flavin reductase family protein [Streptomyces cyaneus]
MAADQGMLRDAMARVPAGVALVTAHDRGGVPHGFTASSFVSVSMEPPLALVCLARTANSFPVFDSCREFAVSVLRDDHTELAMRFARKSADKFAGGEFIRTARGGTVLDGALAVVECTVHERYPAGDHIILLGEVQSVHVEEKGAPAVYVDRRFAALCSGTGACLAAAERGAHAHAG